ncbi:hypothetical protein PG994_011897 [Apiospora phragmitis]|uniref:Secreted protein n=1 Tax=Apiospora phragmitis TaxID=2905665 RepID=A0ABR1TUG4_9PEZI
MLVCRFLVGLAGSVTIADLSTRHARERRLHGHLRPLQRLTRGLCVAYCLYPLQERHYRARPAPSSSPSSLFWFAWTSLPSAP